ncbi:pyridoxamine 5'-phosphate oxidase family protein [Alterinioella nitratireducens]|jgi:general stress protein 26|uniref:pyridoxamine 5'-phosphate oxidase family protein n=1 Tax=Alterinioella nitratireducens TaxID=2735915 RepID=UPI00155668B8|nr:pyridoxamine 5'-phosphate oxidase family protein [Alterinioella nitratireducens]NPD19471.1 pyridoxamine 5'-phosphate oxidase family protein [Alterinioella nitratireducens]|tara:strand:+ start:196 stop:672 length:477 start_codon:yes stop_codon:yes gene_type:complete
MTDLRQEFWKRLDDVQAGMLGLDGQDRLVPMSPQVDDDVPGHVWFITAKGTDLAEGVASGPKDARFVVADAKSGLYADVAGQLRQSNDREALDEVWSFIAEAWFEGGETDPDVCLLQFTPRAGEVSLTDGGAKFLYEIAKSTLTDAKPDAGAQGSVSF